MEDAATMMLQRGFNRLMVATESGEFRGMITTSDLIRLTLEADK